MEHGAQDHDVERLQGLRIIRREITNVEGSPLGKYSACTLHIARVWFKPVIIHIRQVSEDVPGATTNIEHSVACCSSDVHASKSFPNCLRA